MIDNTIGVDVGESLESQAVAVFLQGNVVVDGFVDEEGPVALLARGELVKSGYFL